MTRASVVHIAVAMVGGLGMIGSLKWLGWTWLSLVLMFAIFGVTSLIAERLYRRMATPEQQRADLEDRVRNSD